MNLEDQISSSVKKLEQPLGCSRVKKGASVVKVEAFVLLSSVEREKKEVSHSSCECLFIRAAEASLLQCQGVSCDVTRGPDTLPLPLTPASNRFSKRL